MCLAGRAKAVSNLGAGADVRTSAVLDSSSFGCCNHARLAFNGFARPSNPGSAVLHVPHARNDHR
jgi:hypothetical protein